MGCIRHQVYYTDVHLQASRFLLACLHTDSLLDKRTPRDVKLTLERLSGGSSALDGVYKEVIKRIEAQSEGDCNLAKRVLSWITYAKRPLTTAEICCALAVEPEETELHLESIPGIEDLLSVCAGLVVLDQESAVIRLVHYTTQEYFERISNAWIPGAQSQIATTCLTYLSFRTFRSGSCPTDEEFEERLQGNKFLNYAAKYWGEHARASYAEVSDLACSFLLDNNLLSCAAQVISVGTYQYRNYSQSFSIGTCLHHIAHFELPEIIQDLSSRIQGEFLTMVNAIDSLGRTPLQIAAGCGHTETAGTLLNKGANIISQTGRHGNALYIASAKGHHSMVKLLLEAGADINAQGGQYGNALFAAVVGGHEDTLEMLLEQGANVTALDSHLKGAIHYAINNRYCKPSLVNLLLDRGAPMNTVDIDNMTPLHYSVKFSHKIVAKVLLERGVPADSRVNRETWTCNAEGGGTICEDLASKSKLKVPQSTVGLTPLHFAALTGNSTMTEFLLQQGADPNALSDYGESPLHLTLCKTLYGRNHSDDWIDFDCRAERLWHDVDFEEDDVDAISATISQHRIAVLDALLSDHRTNLTVKNCKDEYPLHCVRYKQPESTRVIQRLISRGADLLCGNPSRKNALHFASEAGDRSSVLTLLSLGADVALTDDAGLNALHYAARSGNHKIVATILKTEKAKAVNLAASTDKRGKNALHHSFTTFGTRINTVRALLSQGVDGSKVDEPGNSPLASYFLSFPLIIDVDICQLLLEINRNASFIDNDGETLGHLYARTLDFRVQVLEVLRKHGVDMTKVDSRRRTVLHRAAKCGCLTTESLEFLLDVIGLQLSAKDSYERTALQYAAKEASKKRSSDIYDPDRWKRTKDVLLLRCPASIA